MRMRVRVKPSSGFDTAIARVTLPATAANLRAATELDEHSDDAWATAVAVAAMSQAARAGRRPAGQTKVVVANVRDCVTNLNITSVLSVLVSKSKYFCYLSFTVRVPRAVTRATRSKVDGTPLDYIGSLPPASSDVKPPEG